MCVHICINTSCIFCSCLDTFLWGLTIDSIFWYMSKARQQQKNKTLFGDKDPRTNHGAFLPRNIVRVFWYILVLTHPKTISVASTEI